MKYDPNQERKQQLNKLAATTAGVVAGGVLLHKTGSTKAISKALGDVSYTMSKVKKDIDLVGRKGLTAEKIDSLYKKHISDAESTWKIKRASAPEINTKSAFFKDIFELKERNIFRDIKTMREDAAIKKHAFDNLDDRFKNIKNRDDRFLKELYIITDEALSRQSVYFEKGQPGEYNPLVDEFKKKLKGTKLEGHEDDIADVLKDALERSEKIKEDLIDIPDNVKDDFKKEWENAIKEKYAKKAVKEGEDRAATAKDIYEALQEQKAIAKNRDDLVDFKDELGRLIEEDESIGDLVVDPRRYRVDKNGQFYSLDDLRNTASKTQDVFSETIAGKLFWTKNRVIEKNTPTTNFWAAASYDPGLAAIQGGKDLLRKDMVKIGDKFYTMDETGLTHIKEADGRTLISGKDGNKHTFINRMAGNTAEKYQDNKILKFLDIGTKGGDYYSNFKTRFTKFKKDGDGKDWSRNIVNRAVTGYEIDAGKYTIDDIRNFHNDIKEVSKLYNNNTKEANVETINKLKEVFTGNSLKILDALDSDDPLAAYEAIGLNKVTNKDLESIIKKVNKDESLKETMTRAVKGPHGKRVIKYDEIVKRELLKEAMYTEISNYGGQSLSGYAVTLNKLERAGLSNGQLDNAKDLMNWAIIQEKGNLFARDVYNPKSLEQKGESYYDLNLLFRGKTSAPQEDRFLQEFKNSVLDFGKKNTSLLDTLDNNPNLKVGYQRPQWMTIKKAVDPLDIIKSINDETKNTTGLVKEFITQFTAGRKNIEDVTNATLVPYHFANRLTTSIEHLGFGFSNASTGSTLDIMKNIGLKRVLPIAAIATTASYLNYRAEAYTGTSFTEAYENAKANFGVGVRTLTSPFDNYLDRTRVFNPIANYWFGDHKDKEEYLDYLENGYDPVRKGRFWSFGSASEFRGGKISYWQPNSLRRAHSHYKDIAIYGSEDNKWAHSIIPTLRHPFSTLRYLSNPYWLEDMHAEDRPYPVSGKLFSEGTPWGVVLNPTLGQLIKPQKRMHQKELQGTGIDVRSIIKQRNEITKERAQENRLIRIDESGITPMMFTPEGMPSGSEAIYTINIDGGRVKSAGFAGQDYAEGMTGFEDAHVAQIGHMMPGSGHLSYGVGRLNSTNTFDNKHAASWLSGIASLVTSNAVTGDTALSLIKQVNDATRNPVASARSGEWFEKGRLHVQPSRARADRMKLDQVKEMVEFNTKKDFVDDMIYSTQQLSGMYGFLFDQIIPAKKSMRWENAGKMASFTRSFWDESVGGVGGNFMEIARRFFPHENHNIEDINPIVNTMPEWLPGRFQTGDPYTKVTKGEARLPGAGYEALNRLRSDKYGRYGALDRMKILGDVAPLSEEYKVWKKIAKAEYTDAASKKEIEGIEARVKAQTKNHDFYNYKFLGTSMGTHNAVISEITNTGMFKIVGSEQEFSLAGIKPLKDDEGNGMVHEYLKAGMKVQLQYENNSFRNKDDDGRISAIVRQGGDSINAEMVKDGAAREIETKKTLADEVYNLTDFNMMTGHVWEVIGHAPIPFIHNKFMRVNSSLESYKHEQVYGTAYSTWDHPIKGFLKPALQETWAEGPIKQALGAGAWALSKYAEENMTGVKKTLAHTAFALANPGAFTGGVIGSIPTMNFHGKGTKVGADIGAAVALAGYMAVNIQNPILSMANFAALGVAAQHQFKFKSLNPVVAAGIGAAAGFALSGLNGDSSIWDINKKYVPKDTEKKWEIEEYYDRLEYLKYTNLYHQAAKKAKRKEGVDVERIVNKYERNKSKNAKLIDKLEKQKIKAEKMIDESAREALIASIDSQIDELLTPIQYLKGGEYTKAAIAYKKAADNTIFGLSKDASTADVLRSLPQYDRDFFLDFADEKDPKKRKEILKYVSPYKAKALQVMWGEDVDEPDSMTNFFNNHNLPNMFWAGWRSDVDLENVKMKTIENEGMLLSDFGMYDSNKNEPAALVAPGIREMNHPTSPLALRTNMLSLLHGVGFQDVDVSVEPSNRSGIQMVANVARVASYNVNNAVSSTLYKLLL